MRPRVKLRGPKVMEDHICSNFQMLGDKRSLWDISVQMYVMIAVSVYGRLNVHSSTGMKNGAVVATTWWAALLADGWCKLLTCHEQSCSRNRSILCTPVVSCVFCHIRLRCCYVKPNVSTFRWLHWWDFHFELTSTTWPLVSFKCSPFFQSNRPSNTLSTSILTQSKLHHVNTSSSHPAQQDQASSTTQARSNRLQWSPHRIEDQSLETRWTTTKEYSHIRQRLSRARRVSDYDFDKTSTWSTLSSLSRVEKHLSNHWWWCCCRGSFAKTSCVSGSGLCCRSQTYCVRSS